MGAILKDQTGCRADNGKWRIYVLKHRAGPSQSKGHFCVADALPSAVLSDNAVKAAEIKTHSGMEENLLPLFNSPARIWVAHVKVGL